MTTPNTPGSDPGTASTPMAERMQALLSRAVEEQVAEQRELSSLLADISSSVERLPKEVRHAVDDILAGLGERLGGLAHRDEVDGVSFRIAERLDALEQRLGRLESHLTPLAGLVADFEGRLSPIASLVSDAERRLAQHVDDAVVALAEALITRRQSPPSPASPIDVDEDEVPVDVRGWDPPAPTTEDDLLEGDPLAADFELDVEAVTEEPLPDELAGLQPVTEDVNPLEPPAPPAATTLPAEGDESDDPNQDRRPWWRPGG
jgi:hypothetical protein